MKRHLIIYSLLFLLFCVLSCRNKQAVATEESSAHDLEQIKDSGELVVLTLYSSTSYFIYRGQDMGFQYELSEQFAKSLGVKLRIEVAKNVPELIRKLLNQTKGERIIQDSQIITEEMIKIRRTVPFFMREKRRKNDNSGLFGNRLYVQRGKLLPQR